MGNSHTRGAAAHSVPTAAILTTRDPAVSAEAAPARPGRRRRTGGSLPRRVPAALAALLALCLTLFAGVPAAQAHDELLESDPAQGATLDQAPDRITLIYSGNITELGNEVRVTDSHGQTVSTGEVTVDGTRVTQRITPDAGDETYTVSWRVVSSDGHPIDGTYGFTVGSGGSGEQSAVPSAEAHEHEHEEAEHHEHSSAAPSSATPAADEASSTGGLPTWASTLIIVVGAVVVLGAIILVASAVRSRRRGARGGSAAAQRPAEDRAERDRQDRPDAR